MFQVTFKQVASLCDMLIDELCRLPTEGDQYTSIHPAFSFGTVYASTRNLEDRMKLMSILSRAAEENKSVSLTTSEQHQANVAQNIPQVCTLLNWIEQWHQSRKSDLPWDWWEEMVDYIERRTKEGGNRVICLS